MSGLPFTLLCRWRGRRTTRMNAALLRRAAAGDYFHQPGTLDHARKDDDLKALRGRADFQEMLTDAAKALPAKAGSRRDP